MGFSFFPHTGEDIRKMLERIGVGSLEDLYADVPEKFLRKEEFDLPPARSEQEVRDYFKDLEKKNTPLKVFVGAGAYDHYTPAVVPYLLSRSEFLTAYTPYQAEISQGTLRSIFEFQSLICELTGLEVSNASMYDGPTAAAEAAAMSLACTRRKKRVLLSDTLLPNVLKVVETYSGYKGIAVSRIAADHGQTSLESLGRLLEAGDVAGVLLPGVNRYGIIEDFTGFAEAIHGAGALAIEYCDPSALAVLRTPAEWDFDIAAGDGQSLGIPLCYGGPYVGFMACRKEYMRKLPGRIVGETRDDQGRRCFVLTLQAREQHIRREKATSNICSNQSLMALFVTVYASLLGPQGLYEVNDSSYGGAHYLHDRLIATGKFEEVFPGRPFLKEFVLRPMMAVADLQERLLAAGYFAALETEEGYVSFCVTEKRTREEIEGLITVIKETDHEIL